MAGQRISASGARGGRLESVLFELSTEFISFSSGQIDTGIERALQVIGEFIGADRGFVFLASEDKQTAVRTHLWLRPGFPADHPSFERLRIADHAIMREGMLRPEPVVIPRVDDLPQEHASLRELLQSEGVKSLVAVPMVSQSRTTGFLGFETIRAEKTWPDETVSLIRVLGEVFVNALDRKKAEEALAEAEAKYRTLVEESLVGICIIQDNRFAYANRRLAEMLGYSQDELMSRVSVLDTIAPEFRADVVRDLKTRKSGDISSYHLSLKVLRQDGEARDAEALGIPIAFHGRPALVGSLLDVTDQVRSSAELHRRMELERVLVEIATGFINLSSDQIDSGVERALGVIGEFIEADRGFVFLIDEDGQTVSNTHEWCAKDVPSEKSNFQGLRIDDYALIGQGLAGTEAVRIPSVDNLADEHASERELLKSENVKSLIALPMTVYGRRVGFLGFETIRAEKDWSEETITLLRVLAEAFVNALERKKTDEALRASEERLTRVVATMADGLLILDTSGRMVFANAAAEDVLGTPLSEIAERRFNDPRWEMTDPSGKPIPEDERPFARVIKLNEPVRNVEIEVARYSGGRAVLSVNAAPLRDADQSVIGVVVTLRDITERRRAEEQRCALEQQLEAHKRRFYRDTILSVTRGKLDICEPPEVRPYILSARLRLEVHDASRVRSARKQVEQFCLEHGLKGERLGEFVIGVGEAITNAIKHAHSGKVYAGTKEGEVWVAVSDKGSGIDSLILPRATLLRGFSTKPSLGLGYSIMLEVCDHVMLKTGHQGTTVVLTKKLAEPEVAVVPEMLPDTWNSIPG